MTRAAPGRFHLREALTAEDRDRAWALRAQCFGHAALARPDRFDDEARHFVVKAVDGGAVLCSFRLTAHRGDTVCRGYAGQVYDLTALKDFAGVMLELGRFCMDPAGAHPDIPRLAWGRMAREVDALDAGLLFGCSSFAGIDPAPYRDAFGLLQARHLAPPHCRPGPRAAEILPFPEIASTDPDLRRATQSLPPLLRSYLAMGGWVSDHVVVDRELNTLHVFTGLEIAAIPPTRQRLLRALA